MFLQVVDMVLDDLRKEHPDAISVVWVRCSILFSSSITRNMCQLIMQMTNDDSLKLQRQTSVVKVVSSAADRCSISGD